MYCIINQHEINTRGLWCQKKRVEERAHLELDLLEVCTRSVGSESFSEGDDSLLRARYSAPKYCVSILDSAMMRKKQPT